MKDSGTLAEAWLVRRLRTWSRKWHGEGKQEMRGRAAKLFQHVFLFWPFPFPRSSPHNARLREEGEGGKGVRESTRGGHFGEIPPPPLSTLTPVHRHWTLVKLSNCWLKTGCCDVQRALSSLVRWLQKMGFFLNCFYCHLRGKHPETFSDIMWYPSSVLCLSGGQKHVSGRMMLLHTCRRCK